MRSRCEKTSLRDIPGPSPLLASRTTVPSIFFFFFNLRSLPRTPRPKTSLRDISGPSPLLTCLTTAPSIARISPILSSNTRTLTTRRPHNAASRSVHRELLNLAFFSEFAHAVQNQESPSTESSRSMVAQGKANSESGRYWRQRGTTSVCRPSFASRLGWVDENPPLVMNVTTPAINGADLRALCRFGADDRRYRSKA